MKNIKKIFAVLLSVVISVGVLSTIPAATTYAANKTESKIPSLQTGDNKATLALEAFNAINTRRAKKGLSSYVWSDELATAANKRAEEISKSFSHTRPDGRSFESVLTDSKVIFLSLGENIGYGFEDGNAMVKGWLTSGLHRELIDSKDYKYCAVGVYIDDEGTAYYTAEFMYK